MSRKRERIPLDQRALAFDVKTESIGPYTAMKRRQIPVEDDQLDLWPDLPLKDGEVRASLRDWGIAHTDWLRAPPEVRRRVVAGARMVRAIARATQISVFGACRTEIDPVLRDRAETFLKRAAEVFLRSRSDNKGFVREHDRRQRLVYANERFTQVAGEVTRLRAELRARPGLIRGEKWLAGAVVAINEAAGPPRSTRYGRAATLADLRLGTKRSDAAIAKEILGVVFGVTSQDVGPGTPRVRSK